MEVHHAHHPGHKKKWSEYLLEFFMLFFAVSLGFLAENIREHYVEKERAHELLSSFMRDVETNVSFTDSLVNSNRKAIYKNDSAIVYLFDNKKIDLDSFFNFLPYTSYRFLNNNETYEQMRSSGSLRYIKDTSLLRMIINYNTASKSAEFRSVTQEFEYVAHEYTIAILKWMPGEIAAKRQVAQLVSKSFYPVAIKSESDKKLIERIQAEGKAKKFLLEGQALGQLKKELIPIITRKVWLTAASMKTAQIVNEQANGLLTYYRRSNKESN